MDETNCIYSSVGKVKVFWKKSSKKKDLQEVNLLLTSEGHIIFEIKNENGEEDGTMATLKVSGIKFSKKDNKIIMTDKTKGSMLNLIVTEAEDLGKLIF